MLAADLEGSTAAVRYPVSLSYKLDGVRAFVEDGVLLSRSRKPIPNPFVQAWCQAHKEALDGADGELIVGTPYNVEGEESVMSRTMSGVMSGKGQPSFTYYIFDSVLAKGGHRERLAAVANKAGGVPRVSIVDHARVTNESALLAYEQEALQGGYEGLMVRYPDGPYKQGRATLKEGYLSKLKRFATEEGTVVGTYELMRNENEARVDALGHTERSTVRSGLVAGGTLGGLLVRCADGCEFGLGGGFTAAQRADLWAKRDTLVGKTVTFKHFAYGRKDAPRFPVFVSFRDSMDA